MKVNRRGLGSHEVLVAIGGQVVPEEGMNIVRWPQEAAICTKLIGNIIVCIHWGFSIAFIGPSSASSEIESNTKSMPSTG